MRLAVKGQTRHVFWYGLRNVYRESSACAYSAYQALFFLLVGLGTRLGEQVIVIVALVHVCVCACASLCVCVTVHVHCCVCTYNVTTELETLWQEFNIIY